MTAPVTRYTKEEMAGAVSDAAAEARQKADAYVGYPRYQRRHLDEADVLDAAAQMLRQAAAEGQGKWEARWKALAVEVANAALVGGAPAVKSWGAGTLDVMKWIEEGPIRATPTEEMTNMKPVSSTLYDISSVCIGDEPFATTMTLRLETVDGRVRYVVIDTNHMTDLSPLPAAPDTQEAQ